jgi:hypothetical protein
MSLFETQTGPGGNITKDYSNPILNLATCSLKEDESFFLKILKIDGNNLCIFNFGFKESAILNCFFSCMFSMKIDFFFRYL